MKFNSRLCLIALPLMATSFTISCNHPFTEPKRIEPYLYEIDYDDYTYDANRESVNTTMSYGCVGIRKGNLYGRNCDAYFSTVPEFVVKVKAKDDRHASLGVGLHCYMSEEGVLNHQYSNHDYSIIPNHMLDGINDAGVVCSSNMLHADEVGELHGSNPGKEDLDACFVVRYVLDHASSAKNAIDLLRERNICGMQETEPGPQKMVLSYLIADPNETYYVCFANSEMKYKLVEDDDQILTNFSKMPELSIGGKVRQSSLFPDTWYANDAVGSERYELLRAHYDEIEDTASLFKFMKQTYYSRLYNPHYTDEENFWFSEMFTQTDIIYYFDRFQWLKDNPTETKENYPGYPGKEGESLAALRDLDDYIQFARESFIPDYWHQIIFDERMNGHGWITMSNSIYDIEQKTLSLTVQEHVYTSHKFSL